MISGGDPGALSATVSQISTTSGLGPYVLSRRRSAYATFADVYNNGDTITYTVQNTADKEVVTGVFSGGDTLSRDTLIYSTTGAFIDWPASGQRIVQPIAAAGTTPPEPDDDTCDIQNVYSGTSI